MIFILKLKKILYKLVCFHYRKITSFYLKSKYKNIKKISSHTNSHIKYEINLPTSKVIDIKRVSKTLKSKYQEILILEKDYIDEILNNIFDTKFRNFIFEKTNLKYSIDYFLLYENKYINKKFQSESIYANHMHIDKPFSPFTIKIFIPINIISDKYGPLEVKISKSNSYSSSSYNSMDFIKFFSQKDSTNIYIFNPSENYHRA